MVTEPWSSCARRPFSGPSWPIPGECSQPFSPLPIADLTDRAFSLREGLGDDGDQLKAAVLECRRNMHAAAERAEASLVGRYRSMVDGAASTLGRRIGHARRSASRRHAIRLLRRFGASALRRADRDGLQALEEPIAMRRQAEPVSRAVTRFASCIIVSRIAASRRTAPWLFMCALSVMSGTPA